MELSELLANLSILVVAVAAAGRFWRGRRPTDRDVFLAFAPFAALGLITFLPNAEDLYTAPAVLVLLYAQPVLFVQLVRHVGKSARLPALIAAVGGVASIVLVLRDPTLFSQTTPASGIGPGLILASVAALVVPNLWVGIQFGRSALKSAGVTQVRLLWASLASFLFIASLPTYSLPTDSSLGLVRDAVSILLAGAFLLGFAPPRWIQRAWRASAYVTFDKAAEAIPKEAMDAQFDAQLLLATKGVLDADAIHLGPAPSNDPKDLSAPTGAAGDRAYLVATFHGPRLFPEDDHMTLNALAAHCGQQLGPRERVRKEMEARKAAEEQASFKASFLRHFGHEVANPLSPIRVQASLLAASATPDQKARLDIINRGLRRIEEIIVDVSGVAKAIDPRAPREIAEVEVGQLLRDAAATYADTARKGNCTLAVEANGGLTIKADKSRLTQVVDNLYSNAIKYSPKGGPIRIQAEAQGDGIHVAFQDCGLGFDPEQGAKLFKTYSRVHKQVAPSIPGSGLGLYLVQEVVHAHGGWAKAESPGPNKGSTFSVWLPRQPPADIAVAGFRA